MHRCGPFLFPGKRPRGVLCVRIQWICGVWEGVCGDPVGNPHLGRNEERSKNSGRISSS